MKYVDLHSHSTFSFLDGVNLPADIAQRAAELGRTAHAITDHGNVSAHPLWEAAAKKVGVKPIFGLEAYFVPNIDASREAKERPTNTHMTILAETDEGYRNLLAMTTESHERGFYYRPSVDEANVRRHAKGLIFLSGCLSSMMARQFVDHPERVLAEQVERGVALARYWEEMVGRGNYFLEAQLFDFEKARTFTEGVKAVAHATDIPLVITNDVHMLTAEERDTRRLLHCIRDGRRWEDDGGDFSYHDEYLLGDDELSANAYKSGLDGVFNGAMRNVEDIADRCNVTLPKSSFIKFPLPEGETNAMYYLMGLVKAGASLRGIDLQAEPWRTRVLYEADQIAEKGFADYFLVVADMVNWAKEHGILVGPGRGSAAGSLICFLLRITEINPLDYGLMFERFIDVTRSDLPDIDLDFDQERREDVKRYLQERYGADRVGILGTFTQWRGKNSLDAVAKVFSVPHADVEVVKALLIDRAPADPRAHQTIEDTAEAFPRAAAVMERYPALRRAALLEGQFKGYSTHACGVLLSSVPLGEVCAIYQSNSGDGVCSVNGPEAETLGLLKIDILALKTLTLFQRVMDEVGMTQDEYYELGLQPHDEEVFRGFREQDVLGVFQFEGHAARDTMLRYAGLHRVLDLAHINALARPGPLESGVESDMLRRRAGATAVASIHPEVDRILGMTYGLMVYQEQVLMVAHEVGQLGWGDCNALRKAMTKKRGTAEFDRVQEDFLLGAVRSGMEREAAEGLWDSILTFGGYGFNLSHAVAYSVLGYAAMWFKRHHRTAFYAALCSLENDQNDLRTYLTEFQRRGGTILPPHVNKSAASWHAEGEGRLRAGLTSIDGIGDTLAAHIVAHAPYSGPEELATLRVPQPTERNPSRIALVANVKTMRALTDAGAFTDSEERDFLGIGELLRVLGTLHAPYKIGTLSKELEADDILISGVLKEVRFRSAEENRQQRGRQMNEATGQVEVVEQAELRRPGLDTFVNLYVEDDTGSILCQINRYAYPQWQALIAAVRPGDVVTVEGSKSEGWRLIRVDKITVDYRMYDGKFIPWEDVPLVESGELVVN